MGKKITIHNKICIIDSDLFAASRFDVNWNVVDFFQDFQDFGLASRNRFHCDRKRLFRWRCSCWIPLDLNVGLQGSTTLVHCGNVLNNQLVSSGGLFLENSF